MARDVHAIAGVVRLVVAKTLNQALGTATPCTRQA
jgi:hypothetical protein